MNQRTTGLVVGLVIFVILTVGLLASTIYFNIEMNDAKQTAKNAQSSASDAQGKERKLSDAFGKLAAFVTGDPNASPETDLDQTKKALGAEGESNLRTMVETIRAKNDQLAQDNANLKKQLASAQADAATARDEAKKSAEIGRAHV